MVNTNFIKLELWRIWIFIFIAILHIYLIYISIHDYLRLKALSIDPAYGGNWKPGPMNFQLSCLLCSITLLPIILLSSMVVTDNLANDGHVLGKDIDNNQFIFDSDDKGHLIRIDVNKSHSERNILFCGVQATIKQQFLPISIVLQIISGFCYLLPLPFVEAQKIQHRVLKPNYLWHTDLDFLIDPDSGHEEFTNQQKWNFQLPMRPAYFNLIFCLSQLTFRYPTVFWRTNRKFSLLFCAILTFLSLHILIDYSSTSILIRLAFNPDYISIDLLPSLSPVIICVISIVGSLILLLTQITLFNYGLNQYFSSLTRHRQTLRLQFKIEQSKKVSDQDESSNVSSETLDVNDTNSSETQECDFHFNKYINHIVAIIFGFAGMSIKTSLLLQNSSICSRTGDRIMYLNIILAIIFSTFWLIVWFGLSLHNTWQFKVVFPTSENQHINTNHVVSVGGVTSSTLPTTANNPSSNSNAFLEHSSPVYSTCHPSGLTLVHRNFTPSHMKKSFDSCEETDLSSCHNYVLLHNATNSKSPTNTVNPAIANFESMLRQSLIKPKALNSPFLNTESTQIINIDDTFGSEKSFNSNFSRSLTVQDKNRFNLIAQDQADANLRHFVNRYYSMEHPNSRKDPRLNIGRSPLLSYQFSTESSPSESQNRRTILDPLTARVSFKDEISIAEGDALTQRIPPEAKIDLNNSITINKQFEIYDLNPTIENVRAVLIRAENNQLIDHGSPNGQFSGINSLINQNGFKDNNLIVMEPTNRNNSPLNTGITDGNNDIINNRSSNYVNINSFDENNSEDERLCSQV